MDASQYSIVTVLVPLSRKKKNAVEYLVLFPSQSVIPNARPCYEQYRCHRHTLGASSNFLQARCLFCLLVAALVPLLPILFLPH